MWADECEELKELPVHCERCGVPEVGYLTPRRTVSVRFAEAPQSLTIPTTNAFSALSLCQPSADDEVAEADRPPFSEVMLSQPPTPDTAGGIEAAFARSAGFSDPSAACASTRMSSLLISVLTLS